jgi:hypothetical protein
LPASPTQKPEGARRDYAAEGMRFEHIARGLRITRPWSKTSGGFILLWAAIWLGMIYFLTGLTRHRDVEFAMWASLPGMFMTYAAMTRFFNRTEIDIGRDSITVRHAPLPWLWRRRFATRDVAAVHTGVKRIYYRGGPHDEFRIVLELKSGKMSMLLKGIEMSSAQMYAIAEAVCDYLGVPVYID